ncbi:putative copper homeostasis (lipo)protein LpqS [Nocardia sp. NPDC003693]
MAAVPHIRRDLFVLGALVVAMLFAAGAVADCMLLRPHGHTHEPVVSVSAAPSGAGTVAPAADHCPSAQWHCDKATLPGAVAAAPSATAPAQPAAVLVLPVLLLALPGGSRGPPRTSYAIVSGRMLLTRLCIARR